MKRQGVSVLLAACMLATLLFSPVLAAGGVFGEMAEPSAARLEERPVETDETPADDETALLPEGAVEKRPVRPDATPAEWVSGMVIRGYDIFTKAPTELPGTGDGRFLLLAQSGVEGDTAVYALYPNSAACQPNNGVLSGQGVLAARLGRDETGALAGYLVGSNEKLAMDDLLFTVTATQGGYTFSAGAKYLKFDGTTMMESQAGTLTVTARTGGGYKISMGNRYLTLYIAGQNAWNTTWQTNWWAPQGEQQGGAGSQGSSCVYLVYPHVDDGRVVTAQGADGTPITANGEDEFVIPSGGRILVDGTVTFTVPAVARSVTVDTNYAADLTVDEAGGFGVMGCTITMWDGTTTSRIVRSGDAGTVPGTVTFGRTAEERLYFCGEGAIRDISPMNTERAPWLDTLGDRRLKSVSIATGITAVGDNAFKCTNMTALTLPEGLRRIGESAFESTKVEEVTLPASLTEIGDHAFRGALGLRQVTLPAGLTTLGTGAFSGCTRLRDVTVAGDTLGSLPAGAFRSISRHAKLNMVFQGEAPTAAYTDFDGLLPFFHQGGAIVYTQAAPAPALVRSGGGDAYFANVNGGDLTAVTLRGGVLPTLPAKGGRSFAGWRLNDTNALVPGGSAAIDQPAGTVFTAAWEGDGDFAVACTVTIDGVAYTVAHGETMGDKMPLPPTRAGYRFAGWVDAQGAAFTADTVVTSDMVIRANWVELPRFTVRFDANGGVLRGKDTVVVVEGETIPLLALPTARREGYTFDGWFTPAGTAFVLTTPITADLTLTAKWTEEDNQPAQPSEPSGGGGIAPAPRPSGGTPDKPETPSRFVDVPAGAWYAEAVSAVADKGVMQGIGQERFAPADTLSRGMMAQILYNMAGKAGTGATARFTDVKKGVWYADAVAWGAELGILQGVSETAFGGERDMSREEMAVMLYRYAHLTKLAPAADAKALERFLDHRTVDDWAVEAMSWCVEKGLLKGRDGTLLAPRETVSRAEAATILQRYLAVVSA